MEAVKDFRPGVLVMMADPEEGRQELAQQVGRTAPVLTPDLGTALGLAANRHFPVQMGRFLARMAKRAEEKGNAGTHKDGM